VAHSFALATITNTRRLKSCLSAIIKAYKSNDLAGGNIRTDDGLAIFLITFTQMLKPFFGSVHSSVLNCVLDITVNGSPFKIIRLVVKIVAVKVVNDRIAIGGRIFNKM
jgi:hypothetical protein